MRIPKRRGTSSPFSRHRPEPHHDHDKSASTKVTPTSHNLVVLRGRAGRTTAPQRASVTPNATTEASAGPHTRAPRLMTGGRATYRGAGPVTFRSNGIVTRRVVPPPGGLSTSIDPPSASTRSVSPTRPEP
jgi:hypothetical protein